jgi:hypothetical protein
MCERTIDITMAEYLLVRADLRQFAVVPEHFIGDTERIVYENDWFAVVAKRERTPADVARDENPEARWAHTGRFQQLGPLTLDEQCALPGRSGRRSTDQVARPASRRSHPTLGRTSPASA